MRCGSCTHSTNRATRCGIRGCSHAGTHDWGTCALCCACHRELLETYAAQARVEAADAARHRVHVNVTPAQPVVQAVPVQRYVPDWRLRG